MKDVMQPWPLSYTDGMLLLFSLKCDTCSHGFGHLLQIQGHSHLTLIYLSFLLSPHSTYVHFLLQSLICLHYANSIFLLLQTKPARALSLEHLLSVSAASLFMTPFLYVHWSQGCWGHTCISSLECVQCLRNVYLHIRHQARSFLKLNPGIKQLWNLVCLKWEGQVFDNHQLLFGLAVQQFISVFLLVFSGVFFYTSLHLRG